MATFQSLQFVPFTFPPSKPPFYKSSPLWSSKPSGFARAADTHLPSLEKQSLAGLRPKISAEERPALHWAGLQVNQTQPESGEPQDGNRDQPVIFENNHHPLEASAGHKAGDASDDCDTRHIERATSQHNTFTTSELASEPHGVASPPTQAQLHTLPHTSWPLQNQTNQQDVDITQRTSALHFIPKASDSGDDGWTDEDTAELEQELELALGEQPVEPLLVDTSATPSPQSVEALQDEIESREREITEGILKELRDVSRRGSPAQDLEWCEQRETQVEEGDAVALQQQEELAQPPVSDVQDLVEVEDANGHEDKEATEALPAVQPKIDELCFRLRGVRTRQLPGRQAKATQYRVVWGEHPNRSNSWVDEDDVQISILRLPYERCSLNLVPRVESNVRVYCMRCSKRSKGKKPFEYLTNKLPTWITEDQLRVSLSPTVLAQLQAPFTDPLSPTQSEVYPIHPANPINDEHHYISRASRSPSTPASPADPVLEGESATRNRGHQDMHTKTSNRTHRSLNTDGHSDTDDEDPRPAKRRKLPTSTNNALTPDESILVGNHHYHTPRTPQSPSVGVESAPAAEYQEWPFRGLLKRITIGNQTTYNLEFTLPRIPGQVNLLLSSEVVGTGSGGSVIKATASHRAVTFRKELTKEQESLLAKLIHEDKTWTEIERHFPGHTLQSLKENFFTKQGGKPRKRGRKPGVKASGA